MAASDASAWHRGYLLYALCVIGVLMFAIDGSIVAVALPTMMTDLNTTLPLITWTLAGYTLAQVALQPAIAKFSDNFGRNRVFLVCVFVFTLSSLLCATAPNVWVLIACRIVQAMGGSGLLPAATGIVVGAYPARQRERLIGLFTSIIPMGAIIGPNLGGLILTQFSWRGIFFINLPIGGAILWLLRDRFRLDAAPARQKPIDYPGILLFATAITCVMVALTSLGSDASLLRSPLFWGLLIAALLIGWVFVQQERRAPDPMLDYRISVLPPFLQVNACNLLYGMAIFSVMAFVPYYAETRFGMTPAQTGVLLTPRSIMLIVMSTVASVWLLKYGYRWPMLAGTAIVGLGVLFLGLLPDELRLGPIGVPPFWAIAISMALAGMGMGTAAPASNNAGIALLPRQAAAIAGLRAMIRSLGGVLGQGLIVVILEFAPDRTAGLEIAFVGFGLLLLVSMPLVLTIPDTARQRRRQREQEECAAAAAQASPAITTPFGSR